jgi:hypothetical protein
MVPGIDQLRDIRGLDPVSWWPPALGWWLIAIAVTLLTLALVWWRDQRQRYPLGSWQKDAQRRLRALRHSLEEWDPKTVAGELSELLRRIAMARYGREACAGLVGNEWLEWLQERDPSEFDWHGQGRLLLELPYAPTGTPEQSDSLRQLIDATQRWVFAKRGSKHERI